MLRNRGKVYSISKIGWVQPQVRHSWACRWLSSGEVDPCRVAWPVGRGRDRKEEGLMDIAGRATLSVT